MFLRPENVRWLFAPRLAFEAADVRVQTADFQRVDFAAIKRNTETLDAAARRQIANLVAASVWKLIGDADRMRELLDQDVSDIAQVKIDAFDIGKLKAACKKALVNAWELGAAQSRREIIKSSGHKFSYDESQHPRDENGRWTDGDGDSQERAVAEKVVSEMTLHPVDARSGLKLVSVNTSRLDSIWQKSFGYVGPNGTGEAIGKRYEGFKEFLKKGVPVYAPNITVDSKRGVVDFGDGRHRTAVLRDMGARTIKVAMDNESIKAASAIGLLAEKHSRISFAKKPTTLRDNAAAYLDANGFRMAQNLGDGARAMIQQELARGVRTGIAPAEVAALILDRLASRGFTDREGIESAGVTQDVLDEMEALDDIADVPAYINTLVRTNTFEAMNEARFAEFTDPELDGWVVAFEYSAILDENTTEFCRYMDGRVYAADNEVWDTHRPPNHYNCRSLLIPITKSSGWDGQESDPPEVDPATGFARCGCGKVHFTYDESQHPRDENGKWTDGGSSAASEIQKAAMEGVDDRVVVDVHPVTSSEAREFGSTLKGDHAYIGAFSKTASAAPGEAKAALQRAVDKADALGTHLLVGAEDDGSGKLIALYESFGFKQINSDLPGTVMLRPASGKFTEHGLPRSVAVQHSESPNTDIAHDEGARSAFEWDESQHPRDERGRFGEGGGGVPKEGLFGENSDAYIRMVEQRGTVPEGLEQTLRAYAEAPVLDAEQTAAMETAIAEHGIPLGKGDVLWRGFSLSREEFDRINGKGCSLAARGLQSTSVDREVAKEFAMMTTDGDRVSVLFKIEPLPDSSLRALPVTASGQSELVLSRDAFLRTTGKAVLRDGVWEVRVRAHDSDRNGPWNGGRSNA